MAKPKLKAQDKPNPTLMGWAHQKVANLSLDGYASPKARNEAIAFAFAHAYLTGASDCLHDRLLYQPKEDK